VPKRRHLTCSVEDVAVLNAVFQDAVVLHEAKFKDAATCSPL
jgi:hypothetical protein